MTIVVNRLRCAGYLHKKFFTLLLNLSSASMSRATGASSLQVYFLPVSLDDTAGDIKKPDDAGVTARIKGSLFFEPSRHEAISMQLRERIGNIASGRTAFPC